jgi:hypothetical protein
VVVGGAKGPAARAHSMGRLFRSCHACTFTVLPTKIFTIEGGELDSVLMVRVSSPQEKLNLYSINSKVFR